MFTEPPAAQREPRTEHLEADLCVVGGGMAGLCAAVTAARSGLQVVLVQDRPVLGGNASSEVRLWMLGATVHMANNNRWAREGGVIDQIMVENTYRNAQGNPVLVDPLLLEVATDQPNLTLLLNTAAYEVAKADDNPDRIASVTAFCSQNATRYVIAAPLFCDASGDGMLGFLAGAAFRMGAEAADEFDEPFAPTGEFGYLLGHSLYFYTRDVGEPVDFIPPSFALKDVPGAIPRIEHVDLRHHGCGLWWIEYGGRLDTVHDTERIKWELWRIVYGLWDYMKNSRKFPQTRTQTLEWVGMIPGKRESRRFEGDYMLKQADVIQRRWHDDDVAHGGWSIDLHPADGVYGMNNSSLHLYPKGIYPIPYRCYYSRNVENLFLAGRIISASHVAFGSTRVMCTCAVGGQAVGMAAAICTEQACNPRDVTEPDRMAELQRRLQRMGQHLIGRPLQDDADLARSATITASSALALAALPPDGPRVSIAPPLAQMLPVQAGPMPKVTLQLTTASPASVEVELRTTSDLHHHCPDVVLARQTLDMPAGQDQPLTVDFGDVTIDQPRYAWIVLRGDEQVEVRTTERRITGVLTSRHVGDQDFTDVAGEAFPVFRVDRRPDGRNMAMTIDPPIEPFAPAAVTNGYQRPTHQPNAWAAAFDDDAPALTLRWDQPQTLSRIELAFDTDFDHAMESVLRGHPERAMPFCTRRFRITDGAGRVLHDCQHNHQTLNTVRLDPPASTDTLVIDQLAAHSEHAMPAIMEVRCYGR